MHSLTIPQFIARYLVAGIPCGILLLACGSGSSASNAAEAREKVGGAKVQCKNDDYETIPEPTTPEEQRCGDCIASKCLGTIQAAIGSDPNSFGGTCGEGFSCVCNCASSDTTCFTGCTAKLQAAACTKSLSDIEACEDNNCAAECKTSSGGGGADGGGSGGGSGNLDAGSATLGEFLASCVTRNGSAVESCIEYYKPSFVTADQLAESCKDAENTFSKTDRCPAEGRVGRCEVVVTGSQGVIQHYYPPSDAASVQQTCAALSGKFVAN